MSVDPLAEKYTYNSPYAFQENKMGMGRELEGLELVYRNDVSKSFKNNFSKTVKFMNEKGTSGNLAKLNALDVKTTLVDNTGKGSYYSPKTNQLFWDPTMAVKTKEGHILSPATALGHEIDHALEDQAHSFIYNYNAGRTDSSYDDKEEKRVIQGSEQSTALKHGEIKKGETTRFDHGGEPLYAPDPTSNKNTVEIKKINNKSPKNYD